MSFRTVVIRERAKLDLKLGYLVCRSVDQETRVFISEISCLILESTSISLTAALISELTKKNVKIIFCDENHNPESEIMGYYGNHNSSKMIRQQLNWDGFFLQRLWQQIIKYKIKSEYTFLRELNLNNIADMLTEYADQVEINDLTNREGHAAKVYFNALFGLDFSRRDTNQTNQALNYGYAILLSCFNREIARNGYLTQLGIWHKNEFNNYNLGCDLMEPFRVLVDRIVYNLTEDDFYKTKIRNMFNLQIKIGGKIQYLENAIAIYCKSIFDAIETRNLDAVKFYEL